MSSISPGPEAGGRRRTRLAGAGTFRTLLPKPRTLTRGHLPAMDYHDVPAFIERLQSSEAIGGACP